MTDETVVVVRNLAVACVILAAFFLIAVRARGVFRSGTKGRLEHVQSIPLGQRTALHIVRVDDRILALGVGCDVRLIADLGSAEKKTGLV